VADTRAVPVDDSTAPSLLRTLDWTDAFWVASGAPALVLFTVGAIASTIGQPSWVIWILSITIGFVQSFTYAEISGLFPHKSGGASVYGAIAWVRYSKFVAPVSVWCNWIAWSPVLALGTGLAAGYALSAMFPADSVFNTWSLTLVNLEFIQNGLTLRINAISVLATVFLLATFALQHGGAARAAGVQKILGVASLLPLLVIGIVPIVTGDMRVSHLLPLLPMAHDGNGNVIFASWDGAGWTLAFGSMFLAGWATYGFETAVCYTREFKDPKADTFKAIFYSGLLCLLIFCLVPLTFQGSIGLNSLLDKKIYDGTGVGIALARLVGGGVIVSNLIVLMLILTLLLTVTTSMMGSSRTLYQASIDGWLPRYLSQVNRHGSPTRAMWTDLGFNVVLLQMSDYFAVLAVSNVCYFFFCFLNLQAGWIHRIDRPSWERPFKCPTWLLAAGGLLGYLNMAFVGAGADLWGRGTLRNGLITIGLIVPVFVFRHYIQDQGKFPSGMLEDMELRSDAPGSTRAGTLPFVALGLCALVIWVAHGLATASSRA
jgi:amino acid transporter